MDTLAAQSWLKEHTRPASELSDSEIESRFGTLIERGLSAFGEDLSYLIEIAEFSVSAKV
jgi:hypothetical protein